MTKIYCDNCKKTQTLHIEKMTKDLTGEVTCGDLLCGACQFVIATLFVDRPGKYEFIQGCQRDQTLTQFCAMAVESDMKNKALIKALELSVQQFELLDDLFSTEQMDNSIVTAMAKKALEGA